MEAFVKHGEELKRQINDVDDRGGFWHREIERPVLRRFNESAMRLFGLKLHIFHFKSQFGEETMKDSNIPVRPYHKDPLIAQELALRLQEQTWEAEADPWYGFVYRNPYSGDVSPPVTIAIWEYAPEKKPIDTLQYLNQTARQQAIYAINKWIAFSKLDEEERAGYQADYHDKDLFLVKTVKPDKAKKPNVDNRMQEEIRVNLHEAEGWTAKKWADKLQCGVTTIKDTPTWKSLNLIRLNKKALKANDRHKNNKPHRPDGRN